MRASCCTQGWQMNLEECEGFCSPRRNKSQSSTKRKYMKCNVNMKIVSIIVATLGLTAPLGLLAQSCCGGGAMKEGCPMGGMDMKSATHEGHVGAPAASVPQSSLPRAVFMRPVQSVYDSYIKVQQALANDSIAGLPATAAGMLKGIQADPMKMLPPKVAQQVEALAKAGDLEAARAALKPLSESLIQYLKDQKVPPGTYHEVYCPMAKASWLQTDKTVMNPYMGKEMIHCGQIKT